MGRGAWTGRAGRFQARQEPCVPSKPERKAAQAALHFLELGHIEWEDCITEPLQGVFQAWESCRDEHALVEAQTIGSIILVGVHANKAVAAELNVPGQLFVHDQMVVADVGEATLQVERLIPSTNVHK